MDSTNNRAKDSLGVLLYELLTGTTPCDKTRLHEAGVEEVKRVIREDEPLRPSTRISTLGEAATTISMHRKTNPARLSRSMWRELDWIVMKALEKDRAQRYESAGDFAKDVRRYLNNESVVACPPSMAYRIRKFHRRNRKRVAAGTVAVVALILGAGIATDLAGVRQKSGEPTPRTTWLRERTATSGQRTRAVGFETETVGRAGR